MPNSGRSVALSQKRSLRLFALLLSSSLVLPMPAAMGQAANVNLGDTTRNNLAAQGRVIVEGGKAHVIQPGQAVTAAEFAALNQVLNTGHQHLVLGNLGNAVGGRLNVGTDLQNSIGNLNI